MTSSSSSSYYNRSGTGRAAYSPSAPPVPEPDEPMLAQPYDPSRAPPNYHYNQSSSFSYPGQPPPQAYGRGYGVGQPPPQAYGRGDGVGQRPTQAYSSSGGYGSGQTSYSYGHGYPQQQQHQSYSSNYHDGFPPQTHPDVIRNFQMVDRDRSGFIDDKELQEALSSGYQRFNIRTIRLLIFLFKNPSDSALRVGPKEFAGLWRCLDEWTAIFERYDRDRSGKIDGTELRDALYSLGYTVPDSVLQLLISRYGDGKSRKVELRFDSFVECGMIVKGLTEKFKEKDPHYTGSAKLSYDTFMSMIIPFLVEY